MIENFMAITKVPRFPELSAKIKAVWPFFNITLVLGVFYPHNSAAKGLKVNKDNTIAHFALYMRHILTYYYTLIIAMQVTHLKFPLCR